MDFIRQVDETAGALADDGIIDLPKLALQFSKFWETDVSDFEDEDIEDIPQSVIDEIQQGIFSLLQYSSVLPLPEDYSLLRQSSRCL